MSDWPKPVSTSANETLRARMIIAQERSPAADVGRIPETEFYLELQNVTGFVGPPMEIYFDPVRGLHCKMLTANGKPPVSMGGAIGGGWPEAYACWITLPYDSTVRLRANMAGYGFSEGNGLQLTLYSDVWTIPKGDTNDYYFSGTFAVTPPTNHVTKNPDEARRVWSGVLELPKMKISVPKP